MTGQLNRGALEDIQSGYQVQYEKLRRDLASLRHSMEEVSETAFSGDGLVAATIGARGELKELVLDPRIYRTTDAKALAASIAGAIRDATAAVTARMVELTAPLLPENTPRGEHGEIDFDAVLQQASGKRGEH